jgi:hypothetical protein
VIGSSCGLLLAACLASQPAPAPDAEIPGRGLAREDPRPVMSAADPEGYVFARDLARRGRRPAASAAEARAHAAVRAAFRRAGLRLGRDVFAVPGRGRSRNVIGVRDAPSRCLDVLMAHADSVPQTPGALDNASGVGALVALAPALAAAPPVCDTWLVATGAEERMYTGVPDHLGALALRRRLAALGRTADLRLGLSLDEVGRGRTLWLRSPVPAARPAVEGRVLRAARGSGLRVRWVREAGTGNSDHRELHLAGLPAAKLGVPRNACWHAPCDTPGRLQPAAFGRLQRLLVALLAG